MGFYSPSQLVQDAKRHGVGVLPLDVTISSWDSTVEGDGTTAPVRLPYPSRFCAIAVKASAGEPSALVRRSAHRPAA